MVSSTSRHPKHINHQQTSYDHTNHHQAPPLHPLPPYPPPPLYHPGHPPSPCRTFAAPPGRHAALPTLPFHTSRHVRCAGTISPSGCRQWGHHARRVFCQMPNLIYFDKFSPFFEAMGSEHVEEHVICFKGHRVLNRNRAHRHLTLMETIIALFANNFCRCFWMQTNIFNR